MFSPGGPSFVAWVEALRERREDEPCSTTPSPCNAGSAKRVARGRWRRKPNPRQTPSSRSSARRIIPPFGFGSTISNRLTHCRRECRSPIIRRVPLPHHLRHRKPAGGSSGNAEVVADAVLHRQHGVPPLPVQVAVCTGRRNRTAGRCSLSGPLPRGRRTTFGLFPGIPAVRAIPRDRENPPLPSPSETTLVGVLETISAKPNPASTACGIPSSASRPHPCRRRWFPSSDPRRSCGRCGSQCSPGGRLWHSGDRFPRRRLATSAS